MIMAGSIAHAFGLVIPNRAMTRRVVVSGGGTGIGLATAHRFAADGDRVVLLGRREDVLRTAAKEVNDAHGESTADWYAADLSDPAPVCGGE